VADLGYDHADSETGTDKVIYFYQVPKSGADDEYTIRASDNPPATGPTGYTDFKLVWASYEDTNSLYKVYQSGNVFQFSGKIVGSQGTTPGGPATITLDEVPVSAGMADLSAAMQTTGTAQCQTDVWPLGDTADSSHLQAQCGTNGETDLANVRGLVPVPGATKQVERSLSAFTGSILGSWVNIHGWLDEWIDP